MELIYGTPDYGEEWGATPEKLHGWICDHQNVLQAMHTLMTTNQEYGMWHHTWANFEPYDGEEGTILCLRAIEDNTLEITVDDDEGEEITELVTLKNE